MQFFYFLFIGLTNPPGLPQFYEIVRPDKFHRPAYFFSWLPPSYPADLGNVEYLLHNTFPPTPIQENSLERFISFDSYYYLHTSVLESSVQTSEGSPYVQRRFNEAKCHKYGKKISNFSLLNDNSSLSHSLLHMPCIHSHIQCISLHCYLLIVAED